MAAESISARHFEIFLAMAMGRNMAEAADALGLSVAAVSKSLKILERETGLELFRMVDGRLRPTQAAEELIPHAQRAVEHLARARRAASELRGGAIRQIVVGVAGPALLSIAPRAIERYRRTWPDARIDLRIDTTSTLIDRIVSGAIDIGIGTPPVREIDGRALRLCDVQDISTNELCAVLPARHRLAARKVVRPADLRDEPLIGLPESSATTRLVTAAFKRARVVPRIVASVENSLGALALVQQGVGVTLVNPIALGDGGFPGVALRMFRPRIVLRTCIYRAKARPTSKSLDDFAACALAAAIELSDAPRRKSTQTSSLARDNA